MLNQISAADFRALKVFQCVAECGSFSGAQDLLNVSESTISSQISGFEKRIGFSLCSRGRTGFRLTERGKVLLHEYAKLMVNIDNFRQSVNSLYDSTVGSLRVGILDHTITETGFSTIELINRFIDKAPSVELHLVQDIQSKLHRDVIEGQLDMALGAFDTRSELIKPIRLYTEHQYLYCAKGHPLFDLPAKKIKLKDLEQCNWVDRGYQLDPFMQLPVKRYYSSATAANIESVAVIILAGNHIGYLPLHFAQPLENQGKLRKILPGKLKIKIDFSLISSAGVRETLAMKTFREICKNLMRSSRAN